MDKILSKNNPKRGILCENFGAARIYEKNVVKCNKKL
jgi:hypothetical protein